MVEVLPDDAQVAQTPFADDSVSPAVRGFLYRPLPGRTPGFPELAKSQALVLTHGAGSNSRAPLLVALAHAFAHEGFIVLACDLPFRQQRPHGPPFGTAAQDRDGLRNAVEEAKKLAPAEPRAVFLSGHSYGGRQASMLAASEAYLVDGLLLLSYPLHPPNRPSQLRTAHLPELRVPTLFVHGSRDPFGSVEEIESARKIIPSRTALFKVEGAGHDLSFGRSRRTGGELPREIVASFFAFMGLEAVEKTHG